VTPKYRPFQYVPSYPNGIDLISKYRGKVKIRASRRLRRVCLYSLCRPSGSLWECGIRPLLLILKSGQCLVRHTRLGRENFFDHPLCLGSHKSPGARGSSSLPRDFTFAVTHLSLLRTLCFCRFSSRTASWFKLAPGLHAGVLSHPASKFRPDTPLLLVLVASFSVGPLRVS